MADPPPSFVAFLRPSAETDALGEGLAEASSRLRERFPQARVRAAVDAGLLGDTEHAAETAGGPSFQAVLHAAFPGTGEIPSGAGLDIAAAFDTGLDRGASAVVAGFEHVIV